MQISITPPLSSPQSVGSTIKNCYYWKYGMVAFSASSITWLIPWGIFYLSWVPTEWHPSWVYIGGSNQSRRPHKYHKVCAPWLWGESFSRYSSTHQSSVPLWHMGKEGTPAQDLPLGAGQSDTDNQMATIQYYICLICKAGHIIPRRLVSWLKELSIMKQVLKGHLLNMVRRQPHWLFPFKNIARHQYSIL